jgi:hypothetical protein
MRRIILLYLFASTLLLTAGCYSFKGFNIDPEIETFYVSDFQVNSSNAPPSINQTFTELLKEKISRESRLQFADIDPDIEFSGAIGTYSVTAVSPEPGETTAFNRLEISVSIQYTDNLDSESNWKNSFGHFEDYASSANLLDLQDELIDNIFTQIIEDIFNKAFTSW